MKKNNMLFVIAIAMLLSSCSKEKKVWEEAKAINTISAYEEYIKNNPGSKFIDSAYVNIEQIHFFKADSIGSISAYEDFLKSFSSGFFADSAKLRIESIEYQKANDEYSFQAFNKFLTKYPQSIYKKQIEDEIKLGKVPQDFQTSFGSINIRLTSLSELLLKVYIKDPKTYCMHAGAQIREYFTIKPENKSYYYDCTESLKDLYGKAWMLSDLPSRFEKTVKIKSDEKKFKIKICNDIIKYEIE